MTPSSKKHNKRGNSSKKSSAKASKQEKLHPSVSSDLKKLSKKQKRQQHNNQSDDDNESLSDIMQWGRDKENYYKEDEEEYSQMSEQEDEVERIYHNQYQQMNNQNFYDAGEQKDQEQQSQQSQQESKLQAEIKSQRKVEGSKKQRQSKSPSQTLNKQQKVFYQGNQDDLEDQGEHSSSIPQEYIIKQLKWTIQLFRDLEYYDRQATKHGLLELYERLLRIYLSIMISLKEYKVQYAEYHPIVPLAVEIKTRISQLMKKLVVKEEYDRQNADQDEEDFQDLGGQINEMDFDEDDSQQSNCYQNGPINGKKNGNSKSSGKNRGQKYEVVEEYEEDFEFMDDEQGQMDVQMMVKGKGLSNKKISGTKAEKQVYHCDNAIKTQNSQHDKGLQYYQKMQEEMEESRKQKKKQKKQQRQIVKKPAFKQVAQDEGRLASQLILKNKGLIKKRKKIDSNSRVKLRKKFQKKKAIHRAQSGHFVRQNPGRAYEGESNIKQGKFAGVKLK